MLWAAQLLISIQFLDYIHIKQRIDGEYVRHLRGAAVGFAVVGPGARPAVAHWGMPTDLGNPLPRVHEYIHPGLYFRRLPGSKTDRPSRVGAPWATGIKPRVSVLANPGSKAGAKIRRHTQRTGAVSEWQIQ